jgi:hypothetical protein
MANLALIKVILPPVSAFLLVLTRQRLANPRISAIRAGEIDCKFTELARFSCFILSIA